MRREWEPRRVPRPSAREFRLVAAVRPRAGSTLAVRMRRAAIALVLMGLLTPTAARAHSARHHYRHRTHVRHPRHRARSTRLAGLGPRPSAAIPTAQPSASPSVPAVEEEPPDPPETSAEEGEQAAAVRELCADPLSQEAINTPEELALDHELQQSCAESGS